MAMTGNGKEGQPWLGDENGVPLLLDTSFAAIGGTAWISETTGKARPLIVALHGGGFGKEYFTGLHSLPAAAAANGADIVLLDRPGANASQFHRRYDDILSDNAAALDEAVAELWTRFGAARPGIFLVGHSIGGAIALMLAARQRAWPLLGVAISGLGDRPPPDGYPVNGQTASKTQPPLPRPALAQVMMAPGAANDAALDALEAATVPVVTEELAAIYTVWLSKVEPVLAAITRPVQIILSEYEVLWTVDGEALARLRKRLRAPLGEVRLWPGVGHCIDYHDQAGHFHDAVLTFMKRCENNLADGQIVGN